MESEDVRILNYVLRWRTRQLEEKIDDAHRMWSKEYGELRDALISAYRQNEAILARFRGPEVERFDPSSEVERFDPSSEVD